VNRGRIRTVLVTGASIAGPALAYWLVRYGFDVTLVERAPTIRIGGYAIDIRGTAIDVVDRMGILPALRAEHVATRQVTFVNAQGRRPIASVNPEDFTPGGGDRHVELARGALTSQLFDLIRSQVGHRFGDAVTSLSDGPNGVEVGLLPVRVRLGITRAEHFGWQGAYETARICHASWRRSGRLLYADLSRFG
jgi:2-polyprenyl-6-methoxyphenol hydroxylase-like FAD-dependent oxidoreductase